MLQILLLKLLFITLATFTSVLVQLLRPGGINAIASEMVILRTQLIALQRSRPRSPKLSPIQRLIFAFAAHFVPARRLHRVSIIIKPATILKFHRYLVSKKLGRLYSNKSQKKGRPPIKPDIVHLVIEIKTQNLSFGCPRIAATVEDRTGVSISNESVGKILKKMNLTGPGKGPSWLTFIGSQVDSLWSVDMFRVESILLKTHWVMLVMDQYSRPFVERAIGTTRREFLDQTLFWNAADLENKLESFCTYFNSTRVHQGISGGCPDTAYSNAARKIAPPKKLVWNKFCSGLYSMPVAA